MAFGAGLTRGAQSEAPYRVTDQRCKGLAVRVALSGVKTWDLAYRIRGTGKMRRLSLGRTTDISLEQARERANELTGAARGGRDLIGRGRGQTCGSLTDHRRVVDRPLFATASCY
jgi:Arm DNA-binding domain